MSLPTALRDKLHGTAVEALTLLQPACGFDDAVNIVATVVMEARSFVASNLNKKEADKVSRLPVELRTMCFKYLGLHSCLRASHVCRAWRVAALGEPGLWNQISKDDPQTFALLKLVFERSRSTTVSITWKWNASEPVLELIAANLHRISDMEIITYSWNMIERFFSAPPPVPLRIQRLNMYISYIPPVFQQLPTLRYLHCGVDEAEDISRIFELCPNLQELELAYLQDNVRLPSNVPQSLRVLDIRTGGVVVNYTPFFTQWNSSRNIKKIRVDYPLELVSVMAFFDNSISSQEWGLVVARTTREITLLVAHSQLAMIIELHAPLDDGMIAAVAHYFEHVRTLTIDAKSLLKDYSGVVFTSLKTLAITVEDRDDVRSFKKQMTSEVPVNAPNLSLLEINYDTAEIAEKWTSRKAQRDFARLVTPEQVESLIISTPDTHGLASRKWVEIHNCTTRLVLMNSVSGKFEYIITADSGTQRVP